MINNQSKYLLLLGANQFQRERAIVGAAKAYGGLILGTDTSGLFAQNQIFTDVLQCWDANPQESLQAAINYEKKTGTTPLAVIPVNDFVLNSARQIATHYGLPSLDIETIKTCRSKYLAKKIFQDHGLPCVTADVFSSLKEGLQLAAKIGYPAVIKPYNLGGSCGVIKVNSAAEFATAFDQMVTIVKKYAQKYDSEYDKYIIEPYITSLSEISVEVLCDSSNPQVLAVTDKYLSNEPYFSEIAHCIPSNHTNDLLIKNTAVKATQALKIKYGLAHVEMKVTKNGPVIIEVGCRTAGDGIMDILERAYGYNAYEAHIRSYMGTLSEMQIYNKPNSKSAIAFFHPNPGRIIFTKNGPDLINSDHVVKIVNLAKAGDLVDEAKDFSTRQGFAVFNWPLTTEFDFIKNSELLTNELITTKKVD